MVLNLRLVRRACVDASEGSVITQFLKIVGNCKINPTVVMKR